MEIKIEHKTTVTLFERAFEMTPNEFKDFLKACRTMLEREGCITDKPMIKITKEGLETFMPGVSTELGNMLLQSSDCGKKEEKQQVTWQEAIQAWAEGKTVIVENTCDKRKYDGKKSFFKDEYGNPMGSWEITNGTWYIED